jgi:hypothetical protein
MTEVLKKHTEFKNYLPEKKLDFLLKAIKNNYDNSYDGRNESFRSFIVSQTGINDEEMELLIRKLSIDHYVVCTVNNSYECKITYSGLIHINRGGYLAELEIVEREKRKTQVINLAFIVAGIYYAKELFVWVTKLFVGLLEAVKLLISNF